MGQRNYKVNSPVKVLYQAAGRASGKTVIGEIYLPSGVKDSSFPDFTLTERGSSGTYVGEFTPDASGDWQVLVHLDDNTGQVTKQYSVDKYDVTGVGLAVEGVETKVDAVEAKIDTLDILVSGISDSPPMIS